MADDEQGQPDPQVEKLVEIMKKSEDDRQEADWDALGTATEEQLQAAATQAGVSLG
jgi:hypothetical protein